MQLFEHQQQACDFAVSTFRKAIHRHYWDKKPLNCGAALLMEMGCGKTVTAIAISQWLYENRYMKRMLIVAPLSILSVWEEELQKFAEFPYTLHGVFATPANSMQIQAATGMRVKVTPGWTFINCKWLQLDNDHYITLDKADVKYNRVDRQGNRMKKSLLFVQNDILFCRKLHRLPSRQKILVLHLLRE